MGADRICFFFGVLMFELRVWGEGILVPVGESASSDSEWAMDVRLHRLELLGEWAASEGHLERGVAWLMAIASSIVPLHG
jgi:hypothetical protein